MEAPVFTDLVYMWSFLWPGCNVAVGNVVDPDGIQHTDKGDSGKPSVDSSGKLNN